VNKYTGEVKLSLGDRYYVLVYDWLAISEFQTRFGVDANVSKFNISEMAETLLIGLKRHHPDVTIDDLREASPPISYVSDKIVEAFIYAQHGKEKGIEILEEASRAADEIEEEVKKKTRSRSQS
jgi:hypothetical protein